MWLGIKMKFEKNSLFVITFVSLVNILYGIYDANNIEPSAQFYILYLVGFLWLVGFWIKKDNKKYNVEWCREMGLMLYIAWPLIILFYLFATRKLKAIPIILALLLIYFGTYYISFYTTVFFTK